MTPQINIRMIEVFRSVMLAGSVVGAARLLHVTQPGVSRTIALLETRLGYPLFERRGRRIVPTAEAEALYREVEHVYVGVDRITQLAVDLRSQQAGALRIATLPALSQWLVPRAVARFLQTREGVSCFVQSLPSRQIADLVSTRQFDVGVVELPMTMPAVRVEPLAPVQTVAVMPAAHALARKKVLSVKDLDGVRLVMPSRHSYVRFQIDDAFTAAGVMPRVAIETPTSSMVSALVAAHAGIGLVSRWAAESHAGPALAMRPLREKLHSTFALIFPGAVPPNALAKVFADELKHLIHTA